MSKRPISSTALLAFSSIILMINFSFSSIAYADTHSEEAAVIQKSASEARILDLEIQVSELKAKIEDQAGQLEAARKLILEMSGKRVITQAGKAVAIDATIRSTVQRLRRRTRNVATTNLASMWGESIPFYGVAIIVAATAYELNASCKTMQDLQAIEMALSVDPLASTDEDFVCGLDVPTTRQLWNMVLSSPGSAWSLATDAYNGTSEQIASIEAPNFGSTWSSFLGWFTDW